MAAALIRAGLGPGGLALLVAACSAPPPDRQTLMAQDWTCEMISEADGLRSRFVETVSLHPSGDYRSTASVIATGPATEATMQLEWTGRWSLSGDTFRRSFSALRATSGEANGIALTQDRLDKAASQFRRGPVAEEGRVLLLSATEMKIATNFDPLNCRR